MCLEQDELQGVSKDEINTDTHSIGVLNSVEVGDDYRDPHLKFLLPLNSGEGIICA